MIDQYTANLRALKMMYELRLGMDDVMHMTTPMFHISCMILSLAALQRGATQVILPQFDYEITFAAMREHQVTFINTVPTILGMALARDDFTPEIFAGLRLIMYTAAPMSLALPDETWGEIVVAAVVPEGRHADGAAIISHCKSQLASYRCPERIFFVEEMPLNAAGKVLRHELAKQMIARS